MQTTRVLKSRTFWVSTAAGISCLTTAAYLYPTSVKQIPLQMLPSVDKLITMDQVKEKLYQNQMSKTCGAVKRMDINSVASNVPTEDEHSEHSFKHGAVIGIYDGHGGPECSNLYSSLIRLSKYLASYVANEIKNGKGERSNVIKNGLKQAFIKLDHDIVNGCLSTLPSSWSMFSRPNYDQIYKSLRQALSGSCAILAVIEDEDIYVANVGDCRAVIGRKVSDKDGGVYNAIELSEDQTGKNPREFSRLCNEHPGEEATLIVRGRVLGGLMPTRAFGLYKWQEEVQQSLLPFMYPDRRRSTPPNYKTPPYVTAEPEVVHYKRDKSDEFMILACDGLWDEMTSQQSVEIVSDLVKTKSFENFATSLIKAGLSDPNNHRSVNMERIQHHLSIPPPKCRRYRDDMTVNVLFLEPIVEMPESSFELMEVPEKQTPTAPQLEKWIKFVGSKTFPKL